MRIWQYGVRGLRDPAPDTPVHPVDSSSDLSYSVVFPDTSAPPRQRGEQPVFMARFLLYGNCLFVGAKNMLTETERRWGHLWVPSPHLRASLEQT